MTLEEQIKRYQMSEAATRLVADSQLLLVASVVGGGKNTIINELMKTGKFHRIISHTTRQPRINHGTMEVEGHDYHFIDLAEAEKLIAGKAFIEVKYVHGNVYGTSVAELQAAHDEHKVAVTDIDIQGVVEYLDVKPNTHAVFLLPPDIDTWMHRLEGRYGDLADHQTELKKRFRTAHEEISHILADERFVLIVNNDLDTTVERMQGVLDGTVLRTSGYAEDVSKLLLEFLKTKI